MEQRLCLKRCSYSGTLGETVANSLPKSLCVCLLDLWFDSNASSSVGSLSLISDPQFCHRHALRNPIPPFPPSSVTDPLTSITSLLIILNNVTLVLILETKGYLRLQSATLLTSFHTYMEVWNLHCPVLQWSLLVHAFPTFQQVPLQELTIHIMSLIPQRTSSPNLFLQLLLLLLHISAVYSVTLWLLTLPNHLITKVVFLWSVNEPEEVLQSETCLHSRMEIYSSETQSWRLLDFTFIRKPNVNYRNGVYCNGALHWVGLEGEMSYYHIDEERVGFVRPSKATCRRSAPWYFWKSHGGDHLHLIDKVPPNRPFEVLEMGKDYSGWFVKYRVDLNPIFTAYPQLSPINVIFLFIAREETEGEDSTFIFVAAYSW